MYTREGTLQSTDNIEHWREILTLPCFYSTYRSFIINMRYVYKVEKDRVVLKYDDRIKEAYLAKRKYSEFSKKYLVYLESIK